MLFRYAQLKIVNKERLQISVQPLLGIEVFKAEFTNDSVKLVDKINKRYVSESIAYYKGKLPVEINIATIQALFMNYLFVPEKGNMEISDLKKFNWAMGINGDLSGKFKNSRQYNLSYKLNNKARHTNTFISDKKENNYLDWRYSQFQDLKGSVFPYASKVSYKSQTKNISLDIKYSKIQIDEKMNISFDIPSSYRKIEFSALINSLF